MAHGPLWNLGRASHTCMLLFTEQMVPMAQCKLILITGKATLGLGLIMESQECHFIRELILDFIHQLGWATGYLDNWSNIILGVCVDGGVWG